jgi:hypothetical protein
VLRQMVCEQGLWTSSVNHFMQGQWLAFGAMQYALVRCFKKYGFHGGIGLLH